MQVLDAIKINRQPFPHAIIDNFLDIDLAHNVEKEFPSIEEMSRHSPDARLLDGWQACPNNLALAQHPNIQTMLKILESAKQREQLAKLFNIEQPLLCDPSYRGTGLLQAKNGGVHQIHRDRNRHPHTHFYPRLILLLYFNPSWRQGYGGELNLWDREIKENVVISPLFNRCVIFENTKHSFHGISNVKLPEGMTRKALNFYYYTEEPAEAEKDTHIYNTEFFASPGQRLEFWKNIALTSFPTRLIDTFISRSEITSKFLQDNHIDSLALQLKAAFSRLSPEKYEKLIKSTRWNLFQQPNYELIERWKDYNGL